MRWMDIATFVAWRAKWKYRLNSRTSFEVTKKKMLYKTTDPYPCTYTLYYSRYPYPLL